MTPETKPFAPSHEIKFPLGQVVGTPAALAHLSLHGIDPIVLVQRHQSGDFGNLDAGDIYANMEAIRLGNRLLSVYDIGTSRVYVITESDRSSTTILLPSEY